MIPAPKGRNRKLSNGDQLGQQHASLSSLPKKLVNLRGKPFSESDEVDDQLPPQ